jgi:predicted permease
MKEIFRRLHYLLNRRRFDEELAADLEIHRDLAARQGGIPLGNMLHLREEARDAWGWTWIDRLFQDLRYAGRTLRKSPGFTVMAVLMLAIGTGINIAAFAFFDFMVLRPLNVRDPATLLRFHRRSPQAYSFVLPYPEMAFVREHSRTLSAVLALHYTSLAVDGEERPLKAHMVSENWFDELGAAARLGRLMEPARDAAAEAGPVVVLGHGFWRRHFGGDPSVIGRVILLNGKPATVIGVASSEFTGLSLEQPDLWAPLIQQPYFAAGSGLLTDFSLSSGGVQMWGRLRTGLTPPAVQEEFRSLAAELHRQHPKEIWEHESIPGEPSGYAQSLLIGGRRGTGTEERDNIYPVAAFVGTLTLLILAVACANLGGLLLARGAARSREVAIRIAVGAGRSRLVRQFLTESLMLAVLGSAAGLLFGHTLLRVLMLSSRSPAWLDPTPDWRIIAFALGVAGATAVLFGLAPALQVARQRHRVTAMRQFLIGAQVAASCVLLIVAALLVRALDHATSTQPGFAYRSIIAVEPELSLHGYTPARARTYFDTLQGRLRQLPGVESVSLTNTPPFGNVTRTERIEVDGCVVEALTDNVAPEFFRTMKIPLLRGRTFIAGERQVVIVSQSLARRCWPAADPLQKQLPAGEDAAGQPLRYTVIGVSGDARVARLEDPDVSEIYFPAGPDDLPGLTAVIRIAGPPENLVAAVRSVAKGIDPRVMPSVQPLQPALRRKLQTARSGALAAGVLGAVALGLACLGIVGVVAYTVSQRIKEIGIRMALGAEPWHVLSAILRQFLLPVAAGLVFGVGGAAGLSRILRRVLYGISGLDPGAYLLALGLFVFAAALAAWLPARRAFRHDPIRALRCD